MNHSAGYHRLGVLGGMGYHATTHFLTMLGREFNLRGMHQDHELPEVLTLSLPLRDWDCSGALSESVGDQVAQGVSRLVDAGAELVAVACNSVHEYYDGFSLLGAPVVHLVRQTQRRASGVLGVLCSAQTRRARLYEEGGRQVIYPVDQSLVDRAIQGVVNGGHPYIDHLLAEVLAAGAESVVLGCTELSLCMWSDYTLREDWGRPVIDSSQVLAQVVAELCATSS